MQATESQLADRSNSEARPELHERPSPRVSPEALAKGAAAMGGALT